MNYRDFSIIIILILIIAAGFFFYQNIQLDPENIIISYLEDVTNVKINYESASIWPLNKITVNNLEVVGDNYRLNIPRLYVGYSIFDYLREKEDVLKIIKNIEMDSPSLFYDQTNVDNNEEIISFDKTEEQIFSKIKNIYLNINNGNIFLKDDQNELKISNLSLKLDINSEKEKIRLDLKKGFLVRGNLNQYFLDDIDTENLQISAVLENNKWDLYLKNNKFSINGYYNLLKTTEFYTEISGYELNNLTGQASINLTISGLKEKITEYKAKLILTDSEVLINNKNNDKDEEIVIKKITMDFDNDNILFVDDAELSFKMSDYNIDGFYDINKNSFKVQLISDNLYIDNNLINPYLNKNIEFNFLTDGKLRANVDGNLKEQNILVDASFDEIKLENHILNSFSTKLRYLNNNIYVDKLSFKTQNEGQVDLSGIYNLSDNKYQIDLNAENIRPKEYLNIQLVQNYIEKYNLNDYLSGILDFKLNSTGSLDFISNIYKVDLAFKPLDDNILMKYNLNKFSSKLLYTKQKLFIDGGRVNLDGDYISIAGEYDFINNSASLKSSAEDINLVFLKEFNNNIDVNGDVSFNSVITGNINNPIIKGEIISNRISYKNNQFEDIKVNFDYNDYKITFNKMDVTTNDSNVTGSGELLFKKGFDLADSDIDLELTTGNIKYEDIKEISNLDFPLYGELWAKINVQGSILKPNLDISLYSDDTDVDILGNRFDLDRSELNIKWLYGSRHINLKESLVIRDDFHLIMNGTYIDDQFDLNFRVDNIDIYELEIADNIRGLFDINGNIKGDLDNPILEVDFKSNNFTLNEFKSEELTGHITYKDDKMEFKELKLYKNAFLYEIAGQIDNVKTTRDLNIKINTDRGDLDTLFLLGGISIPFQSDYTFSGGVKVTGTLDKPNTDLDFSLIQDSRSIINIKGSIGDNIDLSFKGQNISLSSIKFPEIIKPGFQYSGKVFVDGDVKGSRNDYKVTVNTNIENFSVANIPLENLKGDIIYASNGTITIKQSFIQSEDNYLSINGEFDTKEKFDLNLALDFNNYRLDQFKNINNDVKSVDGNLDGDVNISGDLNAPNISGQLDFNLNEFSFTGIETIRDYSTEISFDDDKITIKEGQGFYGNGNFTLSGDINYLNDDNFWDLTLKGNNFSLNRGSYVGEFDPDLKIINKLKTPLIFGALNIHDFIVSPPHIWPESKNGAESLIQPELKLKLVPEEDVKYRNQNIDIDVEGGDLTLTYDQDGINFDGRLTSNRGSIDYYNNKFIVNSASASFNRFSSNIPEVHVSASTIISGTKIFIYVDGPGDNMNISFSSQPELSEKEILALLTRRGGLSGFTSEETPEPATLIQSEFMRIIGENIQLDLIGTIEKGLGDIFSLDRLEIDAYDFGWNREFTVYMGKKITGNLYLEYTGMFGPEEREDEISFKYDLNKYLDLEGGWYGEDDYRFSIEATIEF